MAPLACPLCCNEIFSSHISLKYHILSMVDSLICPSCCEKCDDLMDLADHLGRECKNLKTPSSEQQCDKTNDCKVEERVEASQKESEEAKEISKSSKGPDELGIKTEALDDSVENGEAGSNIVDIDESGNVNENAIENSDGEDEVVQVYTCQMCNINFESVQEHLAKYHEGEEVLLETEEVGHVESQGEEEAAVLGYPSPDETEDDIFEDEGSIQAERTVSRMGQTISEEEMVDKDGMNYTRKVVKIGTDWIGDKPGTEPNTTQSAENSEGIEPLTTTYIVEEGKVRKLTEDEAADITDKTKIIEVHNCPNCNLQFPKMSHFKKHNCNNAKPIVNKRKEKKEKLLKVKEELRYQCTFCLAIYSSLIALNDHMKAHLIKDESGMVHKKTITMTLHVCDICNTKFPTYKQLRLHSRMHDPVKDKEVDPPVSYNIMGQSTEANDDTNNSERETFQCPICEKLYDKDYEEVHLKSHEDQENIVCLVCNRKFDNKENLAMHMKAHSSTNKCACSYCKKPFNSYDALKNHVLNQCQKRQYECQYCGRRFSRPHEKVKHERIHTGEKPHVCQVCNRAFRVSYCLTLHMRTHTNTRPYTCQHCGKRFKSHSVFNHHMQTHSDERNYKCPFCPKAFKTAVQLAGHKNSHTKPFTCNECNRPFASLYAVRAHMETHKRDNNLKFDCWICGASYARSFALKDHMISVHESSSDPKDTDRNQLVITDREQILLDLENATDENEMDHAENQATSEEQHEEGDHQILTEGHEYQIVNEGEVLSTHGEVPDEGYIVHLQPIENSEHIEGQMEVVES